MAIVQVQNVHASSSSAASVAVYLTTNTTRGNFLAALISGPAGASVNSITDTTGNRWTRISQPVNPNLGMPFAEIWQARGIQGGSASVVFTFSAPITAGVAVQEYSGVTFIAPADQTGTFSGTASSTTITGPTLTPQFSGDLFLGVISAAASVSSPLSPYSLVTMSGSTGFSGAQFISTNASVETVQWHVGSAANYTIAAACFEAGASGVNPLLQFPEVNVQISTAPNYQAPVWTDISNYVKAFTSGPIGRQHELDRVQAAPLSVTVDNRDGSFYPWNTNSFLWNNGYGMKPMNPVRVTAAWNGVTYPCGYGYFQSLTPTISDVLNVDSALNAIDIFQQFSLKYLTNDNYAQLVVADGGNTLKAYYRTGDPVGTFAAIDSSGNGNTGSLINGNSGDPAYGVSGAFLYDNNTAVDLTNGTNAPNGGVSTIDNTTQPPIVHNPLGSATNWTVECWVKFVGSDVPTPVVSTSAASVANQVLLHYVSGAVAHEVQMGAFQFQTIMGGESYIFNQLALIDASNPNGAELGISPGVNIYDGQWHHIVIVYQNSATELFAYVDSIQSSFGVTTTATSVTGLTVGDSSAPFGGATPAPIIVDEIAIYTEQLTQAQVINHYNYGKWFQSIEVGASVGPSPSDSRLSKVLAVMGLSASDLVVPYPFLTQLYAETNDVTTTSALNYIQTMTETEPGLIFQGPDGLIYAFNRQYQYLNPKSVTSQATFADSTGTQFHYEGTSFSPVQDDLDIWNDIQVQSGRSAVAATGVTAGVLQEWGPTQSAGLNNSASVYGTRTLQGLTSLQQQNDFDALALAQLYAAWYGFPIPRVEAITLQSTANGGANLPYMLGLRLMDRVTAQYNSQTPSSEFNQQSLLESITHTVTMQGGPTWVTSLALSPYEILLEPMYLGVWTFGSVGPVLVY